MANFILTIAETNYAVSFEARCIDYDKGKLAHFIFKNVPKIQHLLVNFIIKIQSGGINGISHRLDNRLAKGPLD